MKQVLDKAPGTCYDTGTLAKGRMMYMKLKNPTKIRQQFAEQKGWLTLVEIAAGTGTDRKTVFKGFKGQKIRSDAIRKWADALEVNAGEIAPFVEN
jgi:hypothetical protein